MTIGRESIAIASETAESPVAQETNSRSDCALLFLMHESVAALAQRNQVVFYV